MNIPDDILLEEYFDKRTIKPLRRETLIKKLKLLEPKYCPNCWKRLKFTSTKWKTNMFCSRSCSVNHCIKKWQETLKKKYWVTNVSQLKEVQEKKKKNNLKKYWYEYTAQIPELIEKIKKTNIEKYWTTIPANNKQLKEKWLKENKKKYWVEYPIALKKNKDKSTDTIRNKVLNNYSDKNLKLIEWWYSYSCEICWKNINYTNSNEIYNLLQRIRLWFLPCKHCTANNWILQRSWIEILLDEKLKEYWIKTEHQKELDIFLPEYNLWIEVNWIYWHSDKFKDKNYHKNKIKKFKDKWIQIIAFSDIEIKDNINKVINYILWKIWKLPSIWASKCKIKEIDTKLAKDFCEKVHIHWYAWWMKKYWLFYKDELVSVCVVWKDRFNKWNNLEIIRLANSRKVIGWFGRFLKKIKLDYLEYKQINTFIDAFLWLSEDNIFTRYWFIYESWTNPNYKWILWNKVLSRQSTQKHKLLAKWYKWDTENSIMIW